MPRKAFNLKLRNRLLKKREENQRKNRKMKTSFIQKKNNKFI